MVLCAELAHQLITLNKLISQIPQSPPWAFSTRWSVTPDERGERLQSQNERYVLQLLAIVAWSVYMMRERNGGIVFIGVTS